MTDNLPSAPDAPDIPDPAAIAAEIRDFGGEELNRAGARRLLLLWRGYLRLNEATVAAVLEPFPAPAPLRPLSGHAVWCTGHHAGGCAPAGAV